MPVFRARDTLHRSRIARLLDRILPDRLSLVPKRRGYFSELGFADLGFADIAVRGCEEFLWRGQPFAFHIRGFRFKAEERARVLATVTELLDQRWPVRPAEG